MDINWYLTNTENQFYKALVISVNNINEASVCVLSVISVISVTSAISSGVDISEVSGCHFLQQMSSQWGNEK